MDAERVKAVQASAGTRGARPAASGPDVAAHHLGRGAGDAPHEEEVKAARSAPKRAAGASYEPHAEGVTAARSAAERAARTSYGRLVAILAASTGDLGLAEDCLSAAFEQALRTWPASGVPDNPTGWLLTVARNRQRDVWKSPAHRTSVALAVVPEREAGVLDPFDDLDPDAIPDKRLELLFVCAHPAIDAAVRTPLMLQTVLGFEAAQIATAFALPATTMAQRLVRAKRRIKDTRIRFAVPDRSAMAVRLPPVLEAIYGCYAIEWPRTTGGGHDSLAAEAQYLAITLAALLERESEAWGLAALITLSQARASGRSGTEFVPLGEQDPRSWDAALIAEGDSYLRRASEGHAVGRFQLEAAIQAVHCARARTGETDWAALRTLYAALVAVAPTLGARVGFATTVGQVDGPAAGLLELDRLGADAPSATGLSIAGFQPYWAARAHLLEELGRDEDAITAYGAAAALTPQDTVRSHLLRRAALIQGRHAPR